MNRWTVDKVKFGNGETVLNISDSEGNTIAETCPVIYAESKDFKAEVAQAEANARLIAAAPELLEACKFTLKDLSGMTSEAFAHGADLHCRKMLVAAIAKVQEARE